MTEGARDTAGEIIGRMNDRNRDFWRDESAAAERRAMDSPLLETAEEILRSEIVRAIPVRSQRTPEDALMAASAARSRLQPGLAHEGIVALARKGGLADKTDALQRVIEELVAENPSVSATIVLSRLRSMQSPSGPIEEVTDAAISFTLANGRSREASISGLKDRLSRAKKKARAVAPPPAGPVRRPDGSVI
jgi:hypothetical protein